MRTEEQVLKDFEICREQWKIIKDFPNYQVSSCGRIKNKKGIIMKPDNSNDGYLNIKLFNNGKRKGFRVHRLVAQTFIPNPNNYPHINHRNGIKTDNKICNLEWCTPLENNRHALQTGLRKPLSDEKREIARKRMKKLNPLLNKRYRNVIGVNLITGEKKEYFRIIDTEKDGFRATNVYATCKGKTKWHKGWFWYYKEDNVDEEIISKIKEMFNKN